MVGRDRKSHKASGSCGNALLNKFNSLNQVQNLKPTKKQSMQELVFIRQQTAKKEEPTAKKYQSKSEETDMQSIIFRTTADPNLTFAANRRDEKKAVGGLFTDEENAFMDKVIRTKDKSSLQIPRRPSWNKKMDAVDLEAAEKKAFNSWRRILYNLNEKKAIQLTPYEKNIEVWRQLWRTIERSDVLIQIVDGRDPLLYFCEDLKSYIHEHGPLREHLILINKSDFLTYSQRKDWCTYFKKVKLNVVFFSALDEAKKENDNIDDEVNTKEVNDNIDDESNSKEVNDNIEDEGNSKEVNDNIEDEGIKKEVNVTTDETSNKEAVAMPKENSENDDKKPESEEKFKRSKYINKPVTLNRLELIQLFESYDYPQRYNEKYLTIGLIGYPNVGKSSTINCLLQDKKVGVSATPGKTKHFQTIFLSPELMLCDCPGLIFPAFVHSKAELIISGILSIDQMTDFAAPIGEIVSRIPYQVLESTYGIKMPNSRPGRHMRYLIDDLLSNYGYIKGYMAQEGMPNRETSARDILKDFVTGVLLYCKAPPNIKQEEYFIPIALKQRKLNQKPVEKVLKMQKMLPILPTVEATYIDTHKKKAVPFEGKAWKKEHKRKRNTHQKLRKLYPQDI